MPLLYSIIGILLLNRASNHASQNEDTKMTNLITKQIIAKDGLVQAGVWIEEADKSTTNFDYMMTSDNGFTDYFDTDEQLKELCPDSDYFNE